MWRVHAAPMRSTEHGLEDQVGGLLDRVRWRTRRRSAPPAAAAEATAVVARSVAPATTVAIHAPRAADALEQRRVA